MSEARRPDPSGALLGTLVSLLDLVILERQPGGAFRVIAGTPPAWFGDAMKNADAGRPVTVVQTFPVLESFLAEAEGFWNQTAYGRLEGEAFVITDALGRNLPVEPIAAIVDGRAFLLLQRASGFDERQRVLQRAREGALERETLVKQIDGLRRPIAKLETLAEDFQKQPLSEMQAAIVTSLLKEIASLRAVVDTLPKLPPASTARRG